MQKEKELWCRGYEGWHLRKGIFGNAESVEADFCIHCDSCNVGLGLNIGYEGSYQLRVTDRIWQAKGRYALALVKRDGGLKLLQSLFLDETDIILEKEQWFRMRLEWKDSVLSAYINDTLLLTYNDFPSKNQFLEGEVGVWLQPESGGNEARNFVAKGNWREPKKELSKEAEATTYKIDFKNCNLETLPYGWTHMPYENNWELSQSAEGNCFKSNADAVSAITWLHIFENNPKLQLHVKVREMSQGRFGVICRYAPETAYVKVGYDFGRQSWFMEDTPALYDCQTKITYGPKMSFDLEKMHEIEIQAEESAVRLYVDGDLAVTAGVKQTGYGKIGLFSEGTEVAVYDFEVQLPSGGEVIPEVYVHTVAGDEFAASMELEQAPDGTLIGVKKTGVYVSRDEGLSFCKADSAYSGMDTEGYYQSITRLKNGTYLQVLLNKGTEVQISNDLQHWETVGKVSPLEEECRIGRLMYHVSSLAEVTLPDGTNRIFLPLSYYTGEFEKKGYLFKRFGHDTRVYYSDDEGRTWQHSDNSIYDLIEFTDDDSLPEWSESKIVACKDGSIRLYASRTRNKYLCYTESFDYGKSWSGIYEIPEMKCPLSSFSVCEDPVERGTYYLCWINTTAFCRGAGQPRTRLSLARSTDGKKWNYLGDVERNNICFPDEPGAAYTPLFQIIDPCIFITEKYVYISFGSSVRGAKKAKWASNKASHNEQRVKIARLKKEHLKETINYE